MNEVFYYQNRAVQIIRSSRRKIVTLQITAGQILLRVPYSLPKIEIQQVLLQKSRWIDEKLTLQTQHQRQSKRFVSGEVFSCLGRDYSLVIAQGSSPRLGLYQNQLIATVRDKHADNSTLIKRLLIQWYQQQAAIYLPERTYHYAKLIGVIPSKIIVKTFKARWGSCSAKGEIHYNWKILLATPTVVDYLVIHELCHLLHHNHSPQFWKTVEFYLPDYRESETWLKLHGLQLEI